MGGFDISNVNVTAVGVQELQWIKIGVGTGAGKTAWLSSATYGMQMLGDVDLTFRTATGEIVKSGGCDDWGINLRVRGVQAPVCKPLLSVGEHATMGGAAVMYGDKGCLFYKGSNVAKKMAACVPREQRVQHLHETERKRD